MLLFCILGGVTRVLIGRYEVRPPEKNENSVRVAEFPCQVLILISLVSLFPNLLSAVPAAFPGDALPPERSPQLFREPASAMDKACRAEGEVGEPCLICWRPPCLQWSDQQINCGGLARARRGIDRDAVSRLVAGDLRKWHD